MDTLDDRVLATVLFTDVVNSTGLVAELGDRRRRDILDRHDRIVEQQLARFRGKRIKSTGDGTLAVFDGPARAVRCADSIVTEPVRLGLQTRAGLHTGEIERRGHDVAGVAVHLAQRICSNAEAGQVLVSRTVSDLIADLASA